MPHPALDARARDALVTETRAEVAYLSRSRAELLDLTAERGDRVVLVSDEVTRLTHPMQQRLRERHGAWVVRELGGTLRDGFTGRRLSRVSEVLDVPAAPEEPAVRHLRPAPAETVQLLVSQSVHHGRAQDVLLGGAAELLGEALTGSRPTGWGTWEPALRPWDRAQLTAAGEGAPLVVTGGTRLTGTVRAVRTREGVTETTELVLGTGAPGSTDAARALEALPGAFAALAARHVPVLGLVLARAGRRDLTYDPLLTPPPAPLALLLGPPFVRRLGRDATGLGPDARVLGECLYLPLGGLDGEGWGRLDAVADVLGRGQAAGVLELARTLAGVPGGGSRAP
ncbi:DUF6177 family protein [Georgenia phoenicis]|uniref:DUF6177 family protein n=1 Tax=unclassified Georgenia TaxID=2626815 RepID=UPI0039AF16DF